MEFNVFQAITHILVDYIEILLIPIVALNRFLRVPWDPMDVNTPHDIRWLPTDSTSVHGLQLTPQDPTHFNGFHQILLISIEGFHGFACRAKIELVTPLTHLMLMTLLDNVCNVMLCQSAPQLIHNWGATYPPDTKIYLSNAIQWSNNAAMIHFCTPSMTNLCANNQCDAKIQPVTPPKPLILQAGDGKSVRRGISQRVTAIPCQATTEM